MRAKKMKFLLLISKDDTIVAFARDTPKNLLLKDTPLPLEIYLIFHPI